MHALVQYVRCMFNQVIWHAKLKFE